MNQRKKKIMDQIKQKELNMLEQQNNKKIQNEIIHQENLERQIEKENKIKQIAEEQEKKREDTLQWIINKNNKVEEFKRQKELINENQRKIAIKINRKKEEYSQRFHQIFSKKNIDENTLNAIKEMFPNNQEINHLIDDFNEMNGKKNNEGKI